MDSYWQWNKENYKWHYDPTAIDVQYVGRFITEPKNVAYRRYKCVKSALDSDEDAYDEVSIKGETIQQRSPEIMEGY